MTRETKIGLLVGLAFIVVFAMLLSHSGPATPPGTPIQVATAKQDTQPKPITLLPTPEPAQPTVTPLEEPPLRDTASPLPLELDSAQPADGIAGDLPRMRLLEPTLSPPEAPGGIAEVDLPAPPAEPAPMDNAVARAAPLVSRMAPPTVEEPRPVLRDNLPTETPAPVAQNTPVAPPIDPVDPAPARTPALTATRSGEEYVVAKGDTLIGILQKKYGRASEQVMAAFKAANADVKDRHMIREGQKLILPDLGPDFEPVAARSIDLSKPTARTASSDLEKMLDNKTTRKAPEPRETDSKPKSELATILKKPEKKAEPEYRIYEVQPRDNFSTIARDQLGSETLWREIAKLNKNIDPARMLPGTKIKLPAKRPLADTVAESARPRS